MLEITNLHSPLALFRHAELVSASISETSVCMATWTLKQVQGDDFRFAVEAQKLLGISLEGSVG